MSLSIKLSIPSSLSPKGSSFPALLHFAYKYSDSVSAAALANANAGGENVARGSCLGALMGAFKGREGLEENGGWMTEGLYQGEGIEEEVRGFVTAAAKP